MSLFPPNDPSPNPPAPPGADPIADSHPDSQPATTPRRIPNLGHALLFVVFTGLLLLACQVALLLFGKSPVSAHAGALTIEHPKLLLALQAATYLAALLAAWLVYPLLWHRSFLDGIQWHWTTARAQAARLIGLGLMLGAMMQLVLNFVTQPKNLPIDDFFLTPSTAWLTTLFGAMVAPVFEEICFRGFLVPAFAIAYDWLSLPRTENARARWQSTASLSPDSLVFSAILTSVLFAAIHATQVDHMGAALLALFSISLVLTFVRVKTQSVAASTLVHAAYNSFIFLLTILATGGYRHLDRMSH
jgi:membrane protease YdiL (CAAX protease family)